MDHQKHPQLRTENSNIIRTENQITFGYLVWHKVTVFRDLGGTEFANLLKSQFRLAIFYYLELFLERVCSWSASYIVDE